MANPFGNFAISILRVGHLLIQNSPILNIFFVLEGSVDAATASSRHTLGSSDILFVTPLHDVKLSSEGNNTILSVRISPDMPEAGFLRGKPPAVCKAAEDSSNAFPELREILSEIACVNFAQDTTGKLTLHSLVYQLLDRIQRHVLTGQNQAADFQGKAGNRERLSSIQDFISLNYRLPITLGDLAKDQFMTPQYLSRIFKKLTGANFYDYLNTVRLNSALHDLANTGDTITKIAFNNGFPNVLAFNRLFKNTHATLPSRYRKELQLKSTAASAEAESTVSKIEFKSVQGLFGPYIRQARSGPGPESGKNVLSISVDASAGSPLKKIWDHAINLGFASDIGKSNMKAQIEMVQGRIHFQYARFQGIFNEDPTVLPKGNSKGSFYNCDSLIDYLYSVNLLPFIEIGNKPKKINRRPMDHVFNEGRNYISLSNDQIESVFKDFLKHCINRYGISEVGKWKFEFWAEHNETLQYDAGYIAQYISTYARIHHFIKSMVPSAQFGGPGYNMASDIDVLGDIIEGLAALGISPDFVSLYSYPYTIIRSKTKKDYDGEDFSFLWGKTEYSKKIKTVKKYVRKKNRGIREFYITEWNVDYSNRNFLHDACFKTPFILQTIIDLSELINCLSYWLLSDISSEYGDSDSLLYGGAGLINRSGIRKPAYYAYDFLTKLGRQLISKGENHIVTRHSENEFEALVFNYKYLSHYSLINPENEADMHHTADLLEDQDNLELTLHMKNLIPGKYGVKHYILNSSHGSLLDEWIGLNAPENIQQSEVDYLRSICIPKREFFSLTSGDDGTLVLQCNMKPNEVDLYLISMELD